jgi:hypothetical protein
MKRMRTIKDRHSATPLTMTRMPYSITSYARMRHSSQVILKMSLAQVITTCIPHTSQTKGEGTAKIAIAALQSI